MQDQNNLPDPLQTPELPADTMTPEEHERALPVVQEENGAERISPSQEESQDHEAQQQDDRQMDRE